MSKSKEAEQDWVVIQDDDWLNQISTMNLLNFKAKYPDTNEILAELSQEDKLCFLLKILSNENLASEFLGLKHSPNISLVLWEKLYQETHKTKSNFFSAYWTQKLLKDKHDAFCFVTTTEPTNDIKDKINPYKEDNTYFSIWNNIWPLIEPLFNWISSISFPSPPQSNLTLDYPDQETIGSIVDDKIE